MMAKEVSLQDRAPSQIIESGNDSGAIVPSQVQSYICISGIGVVQAGGLLIQAVDIVLAHARLQGRPPQTKPGRCAVRPSHYSLGFL